MDPSAPTPTQQPVEQPADQQVMSGVRKRQQIENTNKRIFLWLAIASVIVSICLVAMQFLVRELLYNQKIISKKSDTNKTLVENIKQAKALQNNVNALLANNNLNALKYEAQSTETTSLNVILDALPVNGDATAFANSLQAVVLPRSGVSIRELNTVSIEDPLAGGAAESTDGTVAPAAPGQPQALAFTAGFSGKYGDIERALVDMSRVIRPISLSELSVRAGEDGTLQVNIAGVTYYLPAKSVEVRMEPITPGTKKP